MAIKNSTEKQDESHSSRHTGRDEERALHSNGYGSRSGANVLESATTPFLRSQDDTDAFDDDTPSIPDIVIRRLPIYVRTLKALTDRQVASVSSDELAELIGVTAAQIRRDLSYFGKFGKQGKGYDTAFLGKAIGKILKLDRQWPVALAGMGKLGHAIANYRGFSPSSFSIVALFDRNPNNAGVMLNDMAIRPVSELAETIRREGIKIGIIATPKIHAQETAELMVAGGVEAILNYAPVILKVPEHVTVREIDPVSALQSMTYYIDRA